jgi:hypothetical protein
MGARRLATSKGWLARCKSRCELTGAKPGLAPRTGLLVLGEPLVNSADNNKTGRPRAAKRPRRHAHTPPCASMAETQDACELWETERGNHGCGFAD